MIRVNPIVRFVRHGRVVSTAALGVLLAGIMIFAATGHAHYPIQHWLFWRFAAYWILALFWAFSCLSAGWWVTRRIQRHVVPATELLLTSFATGVLVFFLGMFVAGLVGGFGALFAIGWPLVLSLAAPRSVSRCVLRIARVFMSSKRIRPWSLLTACFGGMGLAMVYVAMLTPDNVGFDARWYHLPVAEHYVAAGGIGPFVEGWYLGAYPHLASVIYTWAFLLPGTELFDRVLLAAHLEFVLFVATLASIPILVRRLVGGPFRWESFAALFLFPSVLLYDGSLFIAADHVLAFWAIPVYLSLLRVWRDPNPSTFAVSAVLLSGAVLTKYQAVYLLAPAIFAMSWAVARSLNVPARRTSALVGLATCVALGLVLTAPHWLANWAWYGDPVYPLLHGKLADHPWSHGAERRLETFFASAVWSPQGSALSKLVQTARALVAFSFEPHDWPTYHGTVPVFGSLFTIFSFLVPFLKGARRTAALVGTVLFGVGIWFSTSHQDRYLQGLLPWMACATFALAHLARRQFPPLRWAVALAIGLQVVWGGDVYFIPANDDSYEIDRPSPIKATVDLLSSGYRKDYDHRLHPWQNWESIGASLPSDAKLLLHERYLHAGLARMSVSDLPGWQGGISYEDLLTPKALADTLHGFGVTHILWETNTSHESDSFTGDLAFFRLATQWTESPQVLGPYTVARLVSQVPATDAGSVAWYDCPAGLGELRPLSDLDADEPPPPSIPALVETSHLPTTADLAVINGNCHGAFDSSGWDLGANRGHYQLWVRRAPHRIPDREAAAP